jgi:hypothetical protein
MNEALGSIPSTTKTNKQKEQKKKISLVVGSLW